jgi:hypothetical protein
VGLMRASRTTVRVIEWYELVNAALVVYICWGLTNSPALASATLKHSATFAHSSTVLQNCV